MHVQLSGLADKINVHVRVDNGSGYVTFTGTGPVTQYDAVVLSHFDPAYLADVFADAASQLRALTVKEAA